MKYSPLGTSGMDVSRVGFGTWAMSGPNSPSYWGPQDDEQSIATIRHGVERGVGWIDTAAIYGMGHAESVVGAAIKGFSDADRPLVFTKGGMRWDRIAPDATISRRGTRESVLEEVDASLARLGVEQIDLYQMHWPADDAEVEEYWAAFSEILSSGRARAIGLSNHSLEQLERAASIGPVHAVQAPLNLLRQDALLDIIPWARRNGAGVLAYSPMASGLLTGKYTGKDMVELDPADWRRKNPLFGADNRARVDAAVGVLRELAETHDVSMGSVAIAWTLAQQGVSAAIVGARSPEQVDDWLSAGDLELTTDEVTRLDAAASVGT